MRHPSQRRFGRVPGAKRGFSLLEVLVAAAVLALVSGLTFSIINGISLAWRQQKARVSTYEKARIGFELVGQRLAQATLNTYWDYDNPARPTRYLRRSELHFVMGRGDTLGVPGAETDAVFFLAPLGFTQDTSLHPLFKMLTAAGFYVRFSDDTARPAFLDARFPPRWRFRLWQFLQPGEQLAVYNPAGAERDWFREAVPDHSYPLVDNVIGLILRARYPADNAVEESYDYDSRTADATSPWRHQLPPAVAATMVVIDEESATRLAEDQGGSPPPILPPAGAFTDPARYADDLEAWKKLLDDFRPPVGYHVFESDIPIRAARWSAD